MPVNPFIPTIPQPTDNISTSQGQLLQNNGVIDSTQNGFSREHVTMTNTTLGGLHRQATMLNLATLGAAFPNAAYGTYYTSKANTALSTTEAIFQSGDQISATAIAPAILSAVKAWAYCTVAGTVVTLVDGYNIDPTITRTAVGTYTIDFLSDLPSANYGVMGIGFNTTGGAISVITGNPLATTGFTALNKIANVSQDTTSFTFVVLQS